MLPDGLQWPDRWFMPQTETFPSTLPPDARAPGRVLSALGSGALLLGLATLAFSGLPQWALGLFAPGQVNLTTLPVARTASELENLPPGTELLLEGYAQRVLLPPGQPHLAVELGYLAWYEERFASRDGAAAEQEHWTALDSITPTLAMQIRGTAAPVMVGGGYRLTGPLAQMQADTPAVRPSPRAGDRGSWRFRGLRAGMLVTVQAQKTSAAVGSSLPMWSSRLYPASAVDWFAADAEQHRFGAAVRLWLLALGGSLTVAAAGLLLMGRRRTRET